MIIILSKSKYLEDALKNLKIYRDIKIDTVNDFKKLDCHDAVYIIDEIPDLKGKYKIGITLSKKLNTDLKKPFHISTLNSILVKKLRELDNFLFHNKFVFFYNKRVLINFNDKKISLTEKEANLLRFILKRPNHAINKSNLLQELWQYSDDLETLTIETHIYLLKSKFKKLGFENVLSIKNDIINFKI